MVVRPDSGDPPEVVVKVSGQEWIVVRCVWSEDLKGLIEERGENGGTLVVRPDSGDPPEVVVKVSGQEWIVVRCVWGEDHKGLIEERGKNGGTLVVRPDSAEPTRGGGQGEWSRVDRSEMCVGRGPQGTD